MVSVSPDQKIAEGWTSEIYQLDQDCVLKLYKKGWEFVRDREFPKMAYLSSFLDEIPRVFETVTIDGRPGYTMAHISGPSLCHLGKEATDPNDVVEPMFALYSRLLELPAPSHFELLCKRISARISAHSEVDEQIRTAALALLDQLGTEEKLCHGDFHPNNIIISASGPVLIDWNGAGRGDIHADIAKTLILMNCAPSGLALLGNAYQLRSEICLAYLAKFERRNLLDKRRLSHWVAIRSVEFLTFGIPHFQEQLAPLTKTWLLNSEPDYKMLLTR